MDACKCIVLLRHGGTPNSHRATSPIVWLVEGEERWEVPLKAKANGRRKNSSPLPRYISRASTRRRRGIAAIEAVDRNIAIHQNIMQDDSSYGSLKDDEAFVKNADTLKEIKKRMVSELRTIPPCLDPDCTDHTIISKENEPTLDHSKPNDKKKPRKCKNKKQDSEGFAFPTKSARPTTPTLVPEPIQPKITSKT
ncbi:hypothetical protein TNCV_3566931 [Trichonephila clavipes]|nr:hypothetical protein TNCV_3566931 [Trichonephila clavipes]